MLTFQISIEFYSCKYIFEASRDTTGAQSVTVNATACGFDPHSRKLNIYLNLYFHFFALVSKQKCGVDFCHLTRNPSKIRRKVGNRVSTLH